MRMLFTINEHLRENFVNIVLDVPMILKWKMQKKNDKKKSHYRCFMYC